MENLKNNCHPTLYDSDLMFTFTLYALRKITNKENILMAIFAFHLRFGSIVWGSVADTHSKNLYPTKNRPFANIQEAYYMQNCRPLFIDDEILSLTSLLVGPTGSDKTSETLSDRAPSRKT